MEVDGRRVGITGPTWQKPPRLSWTGSRLSWELQQAVRHVAGSSQLGGQRFSAASKMHFSYAGITCYYAILVGESLAANSDRAKPRASSRSRQPFKGQLNASLAQGGSTKGLKNNFAWKSIKCPPRLSSLMQSERILFRHVSLTTILYSTSVFLFFFYFMYILTFLKDTCSICNLHWVETVKSSSSLDYVPSFFQFMKKIGNIL